MEAVLAQAELCDCTADPHGPVEGVVIESRIDKGLGYECSPLLQVIVIALYPLGLWQQ